MPGRWRTAIVIWAGILLYFGAGSFRAKEADFVLIVIHAVLLLAATLYTLAIWIRDRHRGAPEKSYHLSAYPQWFLRFALDENRVEPQEGKLMDSNGTYGKDHP